MLKSLTSLFGLGVDGETVDQRKDRELKELSEKRFYGKNIDATLHI